MELLIGIKSIGLLKHIKRKTADGVIFGSAFSSKYSFSYNDLKEIVAYCEVEGLKKYVSIDAMIMEDDLGSLYRYLEIIKGFDVDGIYFADLGIIPAARAYGLTDKLIYDPITLIASSPDAGFFLSQGLGTVLARELTYEEDKKILEKFKGKIDMQIFGHLRMSFSKRKFLSNYFKQLGEEKDINDKDNLSLVEETREYRLPIRETRYGTEIYTDYCLLMYKELVSLMPSIRRGIVDSDFINNDDLVIDVAKDIKKITSENVTFLLTKLLSDYPSVNFDTGYLYKKTVDKKEDNE